MDANRDPITFFKKLKWSTTSIGPLVRPEEIIRDTAASNYNEVLLEGKVAESLSIIGIQLVRQDEGDKSKG